ncbi:hypothetical protein JHK87_028460 [Glycine soja]|nr:hypothetical protein JHK87_028460 [Glycine soja]
MLLHAINTSAHSDLKFQILKTSSSSCGSTKRRTKMTSRRRLLFKSIYAVHFSVLVYIYLLCFFYNLLYWELMGFILKCTMIMIQFVTVAAHFFPASHSARQRQEQRSL